MTLNFNNFKLQTSNPIASIATVTLKTFTWSSLSHVSPTWGEWTALLSLSKTMNRIDFPYYLHPNTCWTLTKVFLAGGGGSSFGGSAGPPTHLGTQAEAEENLVEGKLSALNAPGDRIVGWVSIRVGLVSTVPVVNGLVRLARWVD